MIGIHLIQYRMKGIIILLFVLIALSYEGTPIVNGPPDINQQPQPRMNPGGIYGGGYPYYYPGMEMGFGPWGFDQFNPWGYDDYGYGRDWDHYSNRRNHNRRNHNQGNDSSSQNRNRNRNRNTPLTNRSPTPTSTPTPTPAPTPTRDIVYGEGTMGFNPSPQGMMNYGDSFMPYGASGRQSGSMIPPPVVDHNMFIRGGKNASPDQCKIEGKFKQLCLKKEALPINDKDTQYQEYYDCFEDSVCKLVKDECKWLQTKRFKQCMSAYKLFIYDKHKHARSDL